MKCRVGLSALEISRRLPGGLFPKATPGEVQAEGMADAGPRQEGGAAGWLEDQSQGGRGVASFVLEPQAGL